MNKEDTRGLAMQELFETINNNKLKELELEKEVLKLKNELLIKNEELLLKYGIEKFRAIQGIWLKDDKIGEC